MAVALTCFVLLVTVSSSHGFFKWTNCVKLSNETTKPLQARGCEGRKPVNMLCEVGYKLAIVRVWFGHGHGRPSKCDKTWFQNCGANTRFAFQKVKSLCQDKRSCAVPPTTGFLGSTSCTFGLDSDLIIDYVCNKDVINDEIFINSMGLAPSPLVLPGTVNVSASLTVKRHLASSTKLKVDLQKKALGLAWVSIPCIQNVGSCTYDNVCELLRGLMFSKCDREMENKGIPCDCPIPTGTFSVPTQSIAVTQEQVEQIPVWDWLASGKYWVEAKFLDVFDRQIGCMTIQVDVDINSKKKRQIRIQWDQ